MSRKKGIEINGYRFSKNYEEKKIIYSKAAKILLQFPGLTKAEFRTMVYDDTRFKNYAQNDYHRITYGAARSHPGNKLWKLVKEGRKIHVYPNEYTQQVADLESTWIEEGKKREDRLEKANIKRITPVYTEIQVGDVVKYVKTLTRNYGVYAPYYGFTRPEDFITINCRIHTEYNGGDAYWDPRDRSSRLPIMVNPLNIRLWHKKARFDKEDVQWNIYGTNDVNFTDSVVLDVYNIPADHVNLQAKRRRWYYEWSFIKILPLNGEEPFWTFAYGWKSQKDKKRKARAIQTQV